MPTASGPYAVAARKYQAEGWAGVLPLAARSKYPPPDGFTGADNPDPSGADIEEWITYQGDGNIALRLPGDVIGIDVDDYGGKRGWDTLWAKVAEWGSLPDTWRSTSRDDPASGIYYYRVPSGLILPGVLGPGVEIIQRRHRYAVVAPSIHPNGGTYRWLTPGGLVAFAGGYPCPEDLPELPPAWVGHLSALRSQNGAGDRAEVTPERYAALMAIGPLCHLMASVLTSELLTLRGNDSRHDTTVNAVMHLFHLRSEGHAGLALAMAVLEHEFIAVVTTAGEGQRTQGQARSEWRRMLDGALELAVSPVEFDPCRDDLRGILPPGWQYTHTENGVPPARRGMGDDSANAGGTPAISPPPRDDDRASGFGVRMTSSESDSGQDPTHADDAAQEASPRESVEDDPHAPYLTIEVTKLRVRREAKRLLDAEEASANWRAPPSCSLKELLSQPDVPLVYTVAECMPQDANVLLTAQYKAGKTTMINSLARCLIDGDDFLRRFAIVHKGAIALWNYEVGSTQYARWLRDLGIQAVERVHVMNVRGFTMPIISDPICEWAAEWLRTREIETWMIDPFARAFTGNGESENSNSDVGRFLDRLDQIKERSGVRQLVLPVHTGRMITDIGSERARGATRLDDWADVRWSLTVVEEGDETNAPGRYWRASGRDVDVAEGMVVMDPITRVLTLTDGKRERPSRKGQKAPRNLANDILVYLSDAPGANVRSIRQGVPGDEHKITSELHKLAQQGLVTGVPGSRNSVRYYRPEDLP